MGNIYGIAGKIKDNTYELCRVKKTFDLERFFKFQDIICLFNVQHAGKFIFFFGGGAGIRFWIQIKISILDPTIIFIAKRGLGDLILI